MGYTFLQPSHNRITGGKSAQQRNESETMVLAIVLMDMNRNKMSELDFSVAFMMSVARLEKSIRNDIDFLRAEMRSN